MFSPLGQTSASDGRFHLHLVDLSGSSQLADEEEEKLFAGILLEKFPPRHFSECPSGCQKKRHRPRTPPVSLQMCSAADSCAAA